MIGKIRFRTKVEIIIYLAIIIIITTASVLSVTRTISDTKDDFSKFIRNSNGKYWEATGENLQTAIWDLNNRYGGKVWVGSDITLSSPLQLKDNIIVDFEGNKVTLNGNIEFLYVNDIKFATVKNVDIAPTATHSASIIKLSSQGGKSCRYNIFENIHILNTGRYDPDLGALDHDYTGIHLEVGNAEIFYNTFRDIWMSGCRTGIFLESGSSSTSFGNGNTFENIWINGFVNAVYFEVAGTWGFNVNLFTNVKAQTTWYSEYGFRKITGNANNFDHCGIWDWFKANNPIYEWWIGSEAEDTYICTNDQLLNPYDQGFRTVFGR